MVHLYFSRLLGLIQRATPSQCVVCRAWGMQPLCAPCTGRFAGAVLRCRTCALPLVYSAEEVAASHLPRPQCGHCLRLPPALHACWAGVDYNYPWDALLAQLKYPTSRGAGPVPGMAATLARVMPSHADLKSALQRADWIVPVPLSTQRLQQRGFNQALEISKHWLSHNPAFAKLQPAMLLRTRDTPSQAGLTRSERLRNVQYAFVVDPHLNPLVKDATIVLVDDVATTTATLNAAADALLAAGAAQVMGVILARTPAPGEAQE